MNGTDLRVVIQVEEGLGQDGRSEVSLQVSVVLKSAQSIAFSTVQFSFSDVTFALAILFLRVNFSCA